MKKLSSLMSVAAICLIIAACSDKTDYKALYEQHVKELSDPKYAGRTDCDNGIYAAAQYIRANLTNMGQTWQDLHFTYPKNTMRGSMEFSVDGKRCVYTEEFMVKEFSPAANTTMEIYHLPDEYLADKDKFYSHLSSGKFADKFVAFDFPLFSKNFSGEGVELYKDNLSCLNGKVGGLIFVYDSRPVQFISRAVYTLGFPVVAVGPWFGKEAKEATLKLDAEFIEEYKAVNIASFIEGKKESDEYIIFMAHYDHLGVIGQGNIFTGANDNASGVGTLLSLMQYYSKNQPEQSLLFLFLDGEEANLLGAKDYVANPLMPLDKVKFAINLDMVGDDATNLICEVGGNGGQAGLDMFKKINAGKGYFTSIDPEPFTDNSDHYYFGIAGVPCIYFTIEGSKYQYYHTPNDTYANFTSERFEPLFNLMRDFVREF